MTEIFENNDGDYLNWLEKHPDGFVLNTHKKPSPKYLMLHRAHCHCISQPQKKFAINQFTGTTYRKICAESIKDIQIWIMQEGLNGDAKLCKKCKLDQNSSSTDLYVEVQKILDNKFTATSYTSQNKPTHIKVETQHRDRDPKVVAATLNRANGQCEICHKPAPFVRASDGRPYLEVHHETPLSEGGDDSTENTLAACPNCHRQQHYG